MSEELKPCPFCGTQPAWQSKMIDAVLMYNVTCYGCSAKIGFFPKKESAFRLWNARATPKLDIEGLKREADAAYCTALDLADKNCRGAQYKLENGKFSNDDLKWHCQHNERIGYHRGMWRVLKELDHLAARGFFGVPEWNDDMDAAPKDGKQVDIIFDILGELCRIPDCKFIDNEWHYRAHDEEYNRMDWMPVRADKAVYWMIPPAAPKKEGVE